MQFLTNRFIAYNFDHNKSTNLFVILPNNLFIYLEIRLASYQAHAQRRDSVKY